MSDYTPTTDQLADWLKWVIERSGENPNGVLAEYRRMIAEVERTAAEKALTDAAHQFATQDGLEALMFARDDIAAVRVTEKWLIDRAAALGLTAGQEGEKDE